MSSLVIKPRKGQTKIKWDNLDYHFTSRLEIFSSDLEEIDTPSDFPTNNLQSLILNCPMLKKLPSFLGSCQSLILLKIKNCKIQNIDNHDYDFPNLKTLQLSGMNLATIPQWIEKSPLLETLDLSANSINTVANLMQKNVNLRRINFDHNHLTNLPDFLSTLPKLNHLSVDGNKFSEDEENRIFNLFKITIN